MEFYDFLARVVSYIPAEFAGTAAAAQALLPAVGLVFALLTCFLGYRLHRVWITLSFAFVGFWGGALLCMFIPGISSTVALWIGLAVAIGAGFLSHRLFAVGLFCYNAWLIFSLVYELTAPLLPGWACTLLALALGIVAGILVLRFKMVVTISTTCVSGAFTAAPMLLRVTGFSDNQILFYTLAVLLALGGAAVQLMLEDKLFGRRKRR